VRFSAGKGQFCFTERDIIHSTFPISTGRRPKYGQAAQWHRSGYRKVWTEEERQQFFYFLGRKNLGGFCSAKATRSHEQTARVFLHHPALPDAKYLKDPRRQYRWMLPCSLRDLLLCQKVIELFKSSLRQGNAMFFQGVIERGQNAFHLSDSGRNPVGLLAEIGDQRIGQIDGLSWVVRGLGTLLPLL